MRISRNFDVRAARTWDKIMSWTPSGGPSYREDTSSGGRGEARSTAACSAQKAGIELDMLPLDRELSPTVAVRGVQTLLGVALGREDGRRGLGAPSSPSHRCSSSKYSSRSSPHRSAMSASRAESGVAERLEECRISLR